LKKQRQSFPINQKNGEVISSALNKRKENKKLSYLCDLGRDFRKGNEGEKKTGADLEGKGGASAYQFQITMQPGDRGGGGSIIRE